MADDTKVQIINPPNKLRAQVDDVRKKFVTAFANPPKEPEIDFSPSVKAALFVLNEKTIFERLKPSGGNLIERVTAMTDPQKIAEEIYLAVLTRLPSADETKAGEFLGVLTIGTHPMHFLDAYSSIGSIPGAAAILARTDGTVYLRVPDPVERVGNKMPPNIGWHTQVAKGGGTYRSTGVFGGEARQTAVKPLANYPLVASVAISENSALAVWRERAKTTIAGGLVLAGAMVWLLRQLYKNFQKTAESEVKLDAAVSHMPQGLIMFDRDHRVVMHNTRFCDM